MDIVCHRTNLLKLVKFCVGKDPRPGLIVTIRATGRTVTVSCFVKNSVEKTHAIGQIEAEVTQPGDVTVNAGDLLACLSNIARGPVQVSSTGDGVKVKSVGMCRGYQLRAEKGATDCPEPSGIEFAMPANTLRRLLRVFSSISPDETRAHVNCALFEASDGVVRVVSTDGYRLCLTTENVPTASTPVRFMVPRQAVAALARMHFSDMDTIQAVFHVDAPNHRVSVQQDMCRVSLVDVDAQFPPYEQVIPASCSASFRLPKDTFADALRAVAVTTNDGCNAVTLSLRPGALLLDSTRNTGGSAHDELVVDYSGEPHHASFDIKYLLDALDALDSYEVTMGLNDILDPCVIEEPGYKVIVMPCRV